MQDLNQKLAAMFACTKCKNHGGTVERLAMSGIGVSRIF
jgi:predicted nucleic-acid-binding Zn-ribbon protein